MITLKRKFIRGAGEKSRVDAETAEQVWELMAAFAGYGFPKAHAASYALVAWQSAWCKTHFPAEFMSAVLANWGGYYSQQIYLMEARRMGLRVRPPHVNHSRQEFSVAYPHGTATLYMGLDQVRDLTHRTQQRTLAARPFSSLQDYLQRVNPRREEAGNLVRCGAFEGLGSIPELLRQLESGAGRPGQLSLFDEPGVYRAAEDWSLEQKAAAQEQILGISVDYHPLERVAGRLQAAGALTTVEAAGRSGQKVLVAGVKQSGHRSRAAGGGAMLFLSLEDLEGMLDVVVFPEIYRRFRGVLSLNEPLLIEGIMENDPGRDEPVLRAERVYRVET
jgi:DNA polymerase III alpha subunit